MGRLRGVEARHERERVFWETFEPWKPDDTAVAESERKDFINLLEGAGGVSRPKGQTEDVYDAYQNIFLAYKNMEALVSHAEVRDPEGVKDLSRAATGYTVNVATLNPQKAVIDALNSIAEERPEDYTAFLGTEEGLTELFQRAAQGTLAAPGFREMTILAPGETGGELIRGNLPASSMTEILAKSVEIALDPTFLAMIAVFPPAGIAAKARLLAEISFGMAAGEEAAEAVGAPPLVGALGGGLAIPTATRMLEGLTRAGRQIALENARRNPVAGQPATEVLRERGVIISGAPEMEGALGDVLPRPRVYYYATTTAAKEKGVPADALLTPLREEAEADAAAMVSRLGGKPKVVPVEVAEGAAEPMTALPPRKGPERLAAEYEATTGAEAGSVTVQPRVRVPEDLPLETIVWPESAGEQTARAEAAALREEGRAAAGLPPEPLLAPMTEQELSLEYARAVGSYKFTTKGGVRVEFIAVPNAPGELSITMFRKSGQISVADMYEAGQIVNRMALANPEYRFVQSPLTGRLHDIYMRLGKGAWTEGSQAAGRGGELELTGLLPGRRNPVRVTNPKGVKLIPEKAVPAMAGGEDLWSIELNDTMIRAVVERPEARDILRKTAEGLANTIPGARRVIEIVNRMALVDEPHLKAALGWQLGKAWQDGQREVALAALRGKSVPFRENAIGQIWLPKAAGQAKPRFGRGEGGWIAVGDVFEDVMRGGKEYLPRLTEEQVGWINDAKRIMAPFTRETEAAMGIKVATREVHWPRFSLDPTAGRWLVQAGQRGRARPPAMFQRIFELQEEAISEFGIRYKPGVVTQMDLYIQGMQHMSRDAVMGQYLRREGVIRVGPRATQRETFAELMGPSVPKWTETGPRREMIGKELLTDIQTLIGPLSRNPLITVPQKLNAVARLLLTGSMDTGVGSLQMATLAFAFPDIWAESMARGLYAAVIDPKSIYRFLSTSPAARRFAQYGGNVGLDSEFFEATRLVGQAIPRVPGAQPVLDVATYPARLLVRRMQVGFEGPLLFGRVLAFDAMADAARAPSLTLQAAGARRLEGKALHEEMFRLARFTDTLLGQPKLGGIVATRQAQFESAWVWFATRYTRSIIGTLSYVAGSGYTPAQARVILSKMYVGGAAVLSGLIAGKGAMQGKSKEEIIQEIAVALNPASGKKHMSMPIGQSWFGMGGAYRSFNAVFAAMADKDNWDFDSWEAGLFDNPVFRGWRSRTAPWTGRLTDLIEGEDFLGYSVDMGEFVDNPMALGEYAVNNFAPITVDAFLQGHGDWMQKTPAAIAEFFGLRTSPETAFEALEPVRNRVSNEYYGVNFDDDRLENNRVARQRVNDHPDVVAVLEGRVRPIQDKRVQTAWDNYFKQADGVRETFGTQKEDLDEITRAGRMDGRTYRDKYGDLQLEEFGELTGIQKALGITFEDEEAPEGTVDAALQAYYAVDLDGKDEDGDFIYYNPETAEYDWEAWYSDREGALTGLSDTDRADVEWYFRHHETELRRDFRKAFDEIIQPSGYLKTREIASAMTGLNVDALKQIATARIQGEGQRAGSGDVWRLVDKVLNVALEARFPEAEPTLSKLRQAMRETNPRLDVELYRQGFVTTTRSEEAIEIAQALRERYPERAYFPPSLAGDVEEDIKGRRFAPAPAAPGVTVGGTEVPGGVPVPSWLGPKLQRAVYALQGRLRAQESTELLRSYVQRAAEEFRGKVPKDIEAFAFPPGTHTSEGVSGPETERPRVVLSAGRVLSKGGRALAAHEVGHVIQFQTGEEEELGRRVEAAFQRMTPKAQREFFRTAAATSDHAMGDWEIMRDHYKKHGAGELIAYAASLYAIHGPEAVPPELSVVLDNLFVPLYALSKPTTGQA